MDDFEPNARAGFTAGSCGTCLVQCKDCVLTTLETILYFSITKHYCTYSEARLRIHGYLSSLVSGFRLRLPLSGPVSRSPFCFLCSSLNNIYTSPWVELHFPLQEGTEEGKWHTEGQGVLCPKVSSSASETNELRKGKGRSATGLIPSYLSTFSFRTNPLRGAGAATQGASCGKQGAFTPFVHSLGLSCVLFGFLILVHAFHQRASSSVTHFAGRGAPAAPRH
ncbi:hypothetical protein BJY52DRAFT_557877 [Lactarius psammicola]|nr:hypothetical protein BJY52DRAFT_557877 [Lactarius psammicola]